MYFLSLALPHLNSPALMQGRMFSARTGKKKEKIIIVTTATTLSLPELERLIHIFQPFHDYSRMYTGGTFQSPSSSLTSQLDGRFSAN